MSTGHIFISHTSADDPFVATLRKRLEELRLPVWVDSRNLRGGTKLAPEIQRAIEQARQVIVVLSPRTINSAWVRREIQFAQHLENRRRRWYGWGVPWIRKRWRDYRVIPLLLPGIEPGALENWFDEEPVAVPLQVGPGGLDEALPRILAALEERLPDDYQPLQDKAAAPVEELLLTLTDPVIRHQEGARRVAAMATVRYQPADAAGQRSGTAFCRGAFRRAWRV